MMNESERYIDSLEERISLGKEMMRLEQDEGFKKIFLDGLFNTLSKDIAQGYSTLDDSRKEKAHKDLYAISFMYQFIDMIKDNGSSAKDELNEYFNTLEEKE